jgi:Mrp family chromosome partitioning ATPase
MQNRQENAGCIRTIATTESGCKTSWRTTLLIALIPSPVSVTITTITTITTGTATSTTAPLISSKTARRGMRALLLDVRLRHDFGGHMQPFAKVVQASGRQGVVVVLPRKLCFDVLLGV